MLATSPTQESQSDRWLDPRTIEKKIASSESPGSSLKDSLNKAVEGKEDGYLPNAAQEDSESTEKRIAFSRPLHVLSLGGSVTWGSINAGSRRQDAYPFVLASKMLPPKSTVTNIAVRATGADLAALCLQSMVLEGQNSSILDSKDGHDIDYDIITVEYSINGIDHLDVLFRRLRERYPRAVVIYIHLYSWLASAVDEISNNTLAMDIRNQIWKDNDRETAWQWGNKLFKNPSYQWSWRHDPEHEKRLKDNLVFIQRELRRINGFFYELPKHSDASSALPWFADDLHHLNEAGHEQVAHDVASIIYDHSSFLDLHSQEPSLGWGDGGDQCISWYSSGTSNQVHVNKDIIPFAPSKYAAEVTMEDKIPLLLEVNNLYGVKMPLALSTMSHKRVYPKAMVAVTPGSGRNSNTQNIRQQGTLLDPWNRLPGLREHHVVQSQFIGYLEPGHNVISISPVETTNKPLRITGVMICRQCGLEEMVPPDDIVSIPSAAQDIEIPEEQPRSVRGLHELVKDIRSHLNMNSFDAKTKGVETPGIGFTSLENVVSAISTEDDEVQSTSTNEIITAAQHIRKTSGRPFLFVMQATVGMIPMVKSWICNTQKMEGVHENTLLLLDAPGKKILEDFEPSKSLHVIVDSLPEHLHGSWDHGTLGYWRMTQHRFHTILCILGTGKVPVMVIEPDALWLENPLDEPEITDSATDIVGFTDGDEGVGDIGFGFLRLNPTDTVIEMLTSAGESVDDALAEAVEGNQEDPSLVIGPITGEQTFFSRLVWSFNSDHPEKNIIYMLPNCRYPSGVWYTKSIDENAKCREKKAGSIVVLQNNWLVGNDAKVKRAKKWGQWFLNKEEDQCLRTDTVIARHFVERGSMPNAADTDVVQSDRWSDPRNRNENVPLTLFRDFPSMATRYVAAEVKGSGAYGTRRLDNKTLSYVHKVRNSSFGFQKLHQKVR